MPQGRIKFEFVIGKPISPELNFPLYFFPTFNFKTGIPEYKNRLKLNVENLK